MRGENTKQTNYKKRIEFIIDTSSITLTHYWKVTDSFETGFVFCKKAILKILVLEIENKGCRQKNAVRLFTLVTA